MERRKKSRRYSVSIEQKLAFAHDRNPRTVEWYTPAYITDALGHFDLDPCSPINRPRDIADRHFDIVDDGLTQPWKGRVWLNPPYDKDAIASWLMKLAQHRNGVALVFARTDTLWFQQYVWPLASGVFFFQGRLKFVDQFGKSDNAAGAPSCLISYDRPGRRRNHDSLADCGLRGRFVSLLDASRQSA